MFDSQKATEIKAELESVQSHYRTTTAMLNGAKQRGSKADIRELTRAKNRISAKLDILKNQLKNTQTY